MAKVLVTGADGFIGSHLTEELVRAGQEVKAFVYYNSFNSWGWLDSLPPEILKEIEIFAGDIRDPNGVRTAMQGREVIYHLAALIAIPFSYHSPDAYVDTNIKGTLNVLQAARDHQPERVLIGADRLAESFYRSFQLPVTIVRPFNTYGPRQSLRAVIPTIITQLLSGCQTIKLGALSPTRDFNYVKDTVAGFMAIAAAEKAIGEEINIATGQEISIGQLAEELIRQINPQAVIACDEERLRPEKSEVNRLLGSNEKIKAMTGWQPRYDLAAGLAETIEFFRHHLDRDKVNIYNI